MAENGKGMSWGAVIGIMVFCATIVVLMITIGGALK